MKTIRTKVYSFNELSEQAKQTAIEWCRNSSYDDMQFSYDDAYKTVKRFNDIFNIKEGRRSWLDFETGHIDDSILELKGLRLQKYLWNNFKNDLFEGKYYSVNLNKKVNHKRVKSSLLLNGNVFNAYYSAITLSDSCVLTGICYDDVMLRPIYDYLDKKDFSNDTTTFEGLIGDCFYAIEKSLEDEQDFRNSDEYIKEQIEANDYQFLSNGKLFNL